MKTQPLIYGVIGLLTGIIIAGYGAGYAVNHGQTGMMRAMGMGSSQISNLNRTTTEDSMSMDDMLRGLNGETGDAFDSLFLNEMIDHHQGAIDMAKLAKQYAKHDEIKQMSDDIIAAQSKEIELMQSWQNNWGYKSMPQSHMMGH